MTERRRCRNRIVAAAFFAVVMLMTSGQTAVAGDEDRRDRTRFYGIIETVPDDRNGTWIIGGVEVVPGAETQFDETEGPLRVGGCAKIDFRQGRIHEIDSEPMEDCR